MGRDCLEVAEECLVEKGWFSAGQLRDLRLQFQAQVDEAVATVQREPLPDPFTENWQALATPSLGGFHREDISGR